MKSFEDYQQIETTTGMNGYPRELCYAITGFETADELNDFADVHKGGRIITIHKRDGWHLWEREEVSIATDFILSDVDYGDNYYSFASIKEIDNEIESLKMEVDDDDERLSNLDKLKKVFSEECSGGNKQILTNTSFEELEIIPIRTLGYYNDTHHYGYAFIMPSDDEEDE